MSSKILIVEDEQDLLETLDFSLKREGYNTRCARTGEEALKALSEAFTPDLVLLDLMLPGIGGTEVCRHLRSQESTRNVPVIMLTAKAEEIDRVVGFEVGADDYVSKPFGLRELVLRVKAILRRSERPEASSGEMRFGRLRVNASGHQVWVDRQEIPLTALEFRLLSTLLARRGRVQSRETLLHDVWGHDPGLPTRTVDTHIQRLRKKIGAASTYIETLRGAGYRFRTTPELTA